MWVFKHEFLNISEHFNLNTDIFALKQQEQCIPTTDIKISLVSAICFNIRTGKISEQLHECLTIIRYHTNYQW